MTVELGANEAEPRSGLEGRRIAEKGLRADIANRELPPGFRLVEADLAERYGVTRHSARLALDVLVGEGLVERIPNRGARVRRISAGEAVAIMECRMVLDGLLASKAARLADSADVARLEANRQRMHDAVERNELIEYSELIQTHHALVRDMAQHPVATDLVSRLQAQLVRQQFDLSLRAGRARESLGELDRVVDAITSRDPALAEEATRAHLRGVIGTLLKESKGA